MGACVFLTVCHSHGVLVGLLAASRITGDIVIPLSGCRMNVALVPHCVHTTLMELPFPRPLPSCAWQEDELIGNMHERAEKFDLRTERVFGYLQVFSAICVIFGEGGCWQAGMEVKQR